MTKKSLILFNYIKSYIEDNKYSPSYDEMRNFMNLKSKSSVFQYIEYLIDHKLIFKDSLKARSIQIRNGKSKINYFAFHISNSLFIWVRNTLLKYLVKNNKFINSYLGKIYKN